MHWHWLHLWPRLLPLLLAQPKMLYARLCSLSVKWKETSTHPLYLFVSIFYKISNPSVSKFPKENMVGWQISHEKLALILIKGESALNLSTDIKIIKYVTLTFVAASTLASLCSNSETTSTWPSLEARWRAFNPFWLRMKGKIYSVDWE